MLRGRVLKLPCEWPAQIAVSALDTVQIDELEVNG
jgi:hypothetical protein